MHTYKGMVIEKLELLNASRDGNPRWKVTFTDGTVMHTQSNASVNYGIENTEHRNVPLTVTTSRAGRITHIEPVALTIKPGDVDCPACGARAGKLCVRSGMANTPEVPRTLSEPHPARVRAAWERSEQSPQ